MMSGTTQVADQKTAFVGQQQTELETLRTTLAQQSALIERLLRLQEPPKEEKQPEEPEEFVTVLYGYGKSGLNDRVWVDGTEFMGGVARNVPMSVAKHWKAGTTPRGTPPVGRVTVTILPNDATEQDFIKETGFSRMDVNEVAKRVQGTDFDLLAEALDETTKEALITKLRFHQKTKKNA